MTIRFSPLHYVFTILFRKNHLELTEMKCMLNQAEHFLNAGDGFDVEDQGYGSMKFNITAGVIDRSRY